MRGTPLPVAAQGLRAMRFGWVRPSIVAPVVAAAACGGTAALILTGHRRFAGLAALAAGLALLATRGAGRAERNRTAIFAGRVLERIQDASVLAPLAWTARQADRRMSILALGCLGAAFVAAYERARGTSLGFRVREPAAHRALLIAILVVGLVGGWVEGALWLFAAITLVTAALRVRSVAVQHRRVAATGEVGE